VSELKSISGSSRLPYGTLALGAEGIKNAIKSFDDAYVRSPLLPSSSFCSSEGLNDFCPDLSRRRKSDIDNERLPPIEEQASSTSASVSSSASSPLPGTNGGVGAGVSTNMSVSGAPATPFRRAKDGKLASAQRR